MSKKRINFKLFYLCGFVLLFSLLTGCATSKVSKVAVISLPQPTRDPALEKKFEAQLQQMNPDAVQVYQSATLVLDGGNYGAAKKLYERVIILAPGFSTAYRQLGDIEDSLKNLKRAEELTRKAVELEPNAYNQIALAWVLLEKDTAGDSYDAFNLASTAVKSLPDDEQANLVLLFAAIAIDDIPTARRVDQHLLQVQPNSYLAHYFAGRIADIDRNPEVADAEVRYSEQLGMPHADVENALNAGISRKLFVARFLSWGVIGLVLWILGMGILFVTGTLLSKATIKAVNQSQATVDLHIKPEEYRLRSIYRVLVNVLSLYFYISIPCVMFSLLLLVGWPFGIIVTISEYPIHSAVLLFLVVLIAVFLIARTLFLRAKDTPSGRLLQKQDAPELWHLVEDVAKKLNTRPVDVIYLRPGTDMAVSESGSIVQKLRGMGTRNLLLGMGMLQALNQGQFAAILAHEYGHFSHQDTAGGDMTHLVRTSLRQLVKQLSEHNVAYVFNPAWLFVLIYQRIFLRLTLGASRLQEVLADRYAAMAYGSQNFSEGLQIVFQQNIAFWLRANHEIRQSIAIKQSISNLYTAVENDILQGEFNKQLDETMKRQTSAYDSHPSPQDRIAWLERLNIPYQPTEDESRPTLELLPNLEQLQRLLTADLMKSIQR